MHSCNEKIVLKDEERQPCEIWSRVMGYHRPISSFNIGKKGEHCERKYFKEICARDPFSLQKRDNKSLTQNPE